MDNFEQFSKDLDKAVQKKAVNNFLLFRESIVLTAYKMIVQKSPVWSGRFRASNVIGIREPDLIVSPANPAAALVQWPTKPATILPARPISNISLKLKTAGIFDTIFLSNNLPYARRIEFDGHSMQAPDGVYRVVAAAVVARFKNQPTLKGVN